MTEITLEYLERTRLVYERNEQRAREMAAAEQDPIIKESHEYQATKTRGMKEAIEGVIFDMTGKFPELH